jgi:hypothetical protein
LVATSAIPVALHSAMVGLMRSKSNSAKLAHLVNWNFCKSLYQRRMTDKAIKAIGYGWVKAILYTLILLPLSLGAGESHAGFVNVVREGKTTMVIVGGELLPGDGDVFRTQTSPLSSAIVMFWSVGGNLMAGIEIGEAIRAKGFDTFVTYRCASACALAWLGGAHRWMTPDALIGFHAASDAQGEVTGIGNAVMGAYLNKIGLRYEAVEYITSALPNSVTWLSMEDAKQVGIEVSLFRPPK